MERPGDEEVALPDPADPADPSGSTDASAAEAHTPPAEAELRTFLIADIRGYTVYTTENGADAAAHLAGQFAAIVREVVVAHDGFLLELRGDEALAVFVLARRALRAALELQIRFAAELPRGVGIGLDAGEAIPVEGGYRGSALNLAARLCGQAGPGETLASEAVIHLAAKVDGIGYADPKTYHLKGMDEPIRAVHVVSADKASKKPIRYGGDGTRVDRRLLAVAGVAVVAVAVMAAGLSGVFGGGGGPSPSPSASAAVAASPAPSTGPLGTAELPILAFIDPKTGEITDTKPFHEPTDVAGYADGSFWVLGLDPVAVHQIDPESHDAIRSIGIPLAKEGWGTVHDGTIWFTDGAAPRVIGLDTRTGVQIHDFSVAADANDDRNASGVAVGDGSLWVSLPGRDFGEGEIVRLDPSTGDVQARVTGLDFPDILAFGEDAVWVTGAGKMSRVDPTTNRVTFSTNLADIFLPFIEFAGGAAWTASDELGKVWKVDRSGHDTEYDVGIGARAIAPLGDTLWVAVQDQGKLVGIDVTTGAQREIETGHLVSTVASDGDELMVAVDLTPEERIAATAGEVLTIAAPYGPFYSPDPPVNASFEFRQTGYVTCAGLLRYKNETAPSGWELVPEVAAAMPEVSADGRIYTFTVRDGFAFSPPVDEPVTAETYRSTIERALSPVLNAYGARFLGDIEGAASYRAGKAAHISGLKADGATLTIRLNKPSGDFLNRLSLTYFCPVPRGTPVIRDGLDPTPPLAAAGPYYATYHLGGELFVVKKNPNYGGDRPQPWDAIAWRTGFPPGEAIGHAESGETDAAVAGAFEPLLNAQSRLAEQWGPDSDAAAAGDQRWFGGPRFGTEFLHLNPARLFADRDVRRAVSLAIDRAALAAWFGEEPFAGLLVPSVPGSPPAGTPVPAPDAAAARALLAGRTGSVVMGVPDNCPECKDVADTVAGALKPIGIEVKVKVYDDLQAEISKPHSEVDIYDGFLDTDYPDPVALLGHLARTRWIGKANLAELERLQALSGQERIDAAAAFATRMSDDEAFAVAFGYPVYPFYLGPKVGCGYVQPAIGAVDLLSLCRKP